MHLKCTQLAELPLYVEEDKGTGDTIYCWTRCSVAHKGGRWAT